MIQDRKTPIPLQNRRQVLKFCTQEYRPLALVGCNLRGSSSYGTGNPCNKLAAISCKSPDLRSGRILFLLRPYPTFSQRFSPLQWRTFVQTTNAVFGTSLRIQCRLRVVYPHSSTSPPDFLIKPLQPAIARYFMHQPNFILSFVL